MSRCFPFPPPGYEKKDVAQNVNLIIKEKRHKEKKHKNKKDKEKKEKSEQKEKERSEGKNKEDKDRKEKKHRDKKDKNKDKQRPSEETKVLGSSENQNCEKFSPVNKPSDGIQDSRFLVELGKRLRDDGETGSQMVQKIKFIDQRKANLQRTAEENGVCAFAEAYDKIKEKTEHRGGEKFGLVKKCSNGIHGGRILVELDNKEKDNGETRSEMVQKITLIDERKANLPSTTEKNSGGALAEAHDKIIGKRNCEKVGPVKKPSNRIQGNGVLVEVSKRVRGDGETGSQMVQKITFIDQRKANLLRTVEENSGALAEAYDKTVQKREHSKISNGQSLKVETSSLADGSFSGQNQNKVEGDFCQVETGDKRKEKKEKDTHKSSDVKGDRRKNDDRYKNTKADDKKRKKEKKKEKVKDKSKAQVKQKETYLNFLDVAKHNIPSNFLNESHDSQRSPLKRKEPEMNGFRHVNGTRADILSRSVSFSHEVIQNESGLNSSELNMAAEKEVGILDPRVNGKLSSSQPTLENVRNVEHAKTAKNFTSENASPTVNDHAGSNGLIPLQTVSILRKVGPCQITISVEKMEQGVVNDCKSGVEVPSSHPVWGNGKKVAAPIIGNQESFSSHKIDNKGSGMNGVLHGKSHTSLKLSSASVEARKKVEASMKPPHPDSKYLSQILTIPKLEWPEFDDQDWLFGCKDSQTKRAKVVYSPIESIKQVWAEAIHMESGDVTALPYVVPY